MGDACNYSGEFNNGKKNGIGRYKWIDDTSYEGEIKNNFFDGFGIYAYFDGRKFEGEWKKNHINGYGEMEWVEGNKYYGFYKEGKKIILMDMGKWSGLKEINIMDFIRRIKEKDLGFIIFRKINSM